MSELNDLEIEDMFEDMLRRTEALTEKLSDPTYDGDPSEEWL